MKNKKISFNGSIRQLGLAVIMAAATTVQAQTTLYQGHTDIGIDYDQTINEWDLHVHDEVNDVEYSPATNALLFVKNAAYGTVPAGAQWSFLGAAGSGIWTLPKVQDPNLLFAGFGAEEIDNGIFVGDQFTMALKSVVGPGNFTIYDVDSFGNPIVWMNTGDGISGADSRVLPSGVHSHINITFSAPGDYAVYFEATANSVLNGLTSSGDVPYLFHVEAVPEPGTFALAGLGIAAICFSRRRT